MTSHFISWWNLENLFEVSNSPSRPEWLSRQLKSELKGWTQSVLQKKLTNLASVILKMNNGSGPDVIGICEVENEAVVQKLVSELSELNRNYQVLHQNTADQRGIDVAFIYDADKYTFEGELFSYEVLKRSATRDILQVGLKTQQGTELILIGNHWPSRSGGQYKSEPYRMIVGETLSYWLKRIQEIKGKDAAVVVMGDFNDEPSNRALKEYALSTESRNKVVYGKNPYLYNLMYQLPGENQGTFVFNAEMLMLDQFLVSKGIAKKSGKFKIEIDAVKIESFEGMQSGRYATPVRFGRPSKSSSYNPKGFSDHLPISFHLIEK